MDVKIGLRDIARDVTIDVDMTPDEVQQALADAQGVLRLEDPKGRVLLVATEAVAYVDCGHDAVRPVGFGTA